ncbi:MAG: hypothetical protein J6V84_00190, partial [Clostridia bacterium]|nr:hypothetical protein [Clostridia bacterium]
MKRIISLVLLSLCIIAVCVPLYSCESTESGGQTGRQFAYGELVCISMVSMSSVNPYETLDFNYSEIARIKEKLLYISPDLMMFSTVVYENDIQPVWEETGTLSKSSLDFKFIDSETKWSEGHSLQHITENVESVYSQATDTDQTIQLILLKDQTAYLAVCSKNSETVYLLEETDISYHEDIRRPSFEVFTFTASGNAEEYTVFKKNVLCFYNNRTEFFLQCAENTAGGIHGKVTETRDGYLLETNDGKYKLIVHTDNDTMYLTAESPE